MNNRQEPVEPAPHVAEIVHESLASAKAWLSDYRRRDAGSRVMPDEIRQALAEAKQAAVVERNQARAKAAWCLESAAEIQTDYLGSFGLMREHSFYSAWCKLERAEVALHFLDRHLRDVRNVFGLELVRSQVKQFQGLFPYQLFISPEFWEKEVRCSICDTPIKPRTGCAHRVGEIYDGQICVRHVTSTQILGVSIVRTPVQKYSALYTVDPACAGGSPNPDAYPMVAYVADRLQSPWDRFSYEWTQERHPHARYSDVARSAPCPCIAPKGSYEDCCGLTEGVLRPHLRVTFDQMPHEQIAQTLYV